VTTTFLINSGKQRYAWITVLPMVFVGVTTLCAAYLSITTIFWPLAQVPGTRLQGSLDAALMSFFMLGVVLVVTAAMRRCWATLHGEPLPVDAFGAEKPPATAVKIGCC
jgi:carbon starvation protein